MMLMVIVLMLTTNDVIVVRTHDGSIATTHAERTARRGACM